ncbi:MAG TPA: LuxR C-terminal-related transcriptional regulator [Baekduia sp.]|uniref:response regulator transcription factor n=1 Tax=Baekduia sp. TaxID=2600305 RepID=UPI002D77084E|nr:LuxR C-terminal-related transcriptional regulator [Baekduia sp.]HET6509160.1 LuxR C-terminal-related transcriptional regulator [Baekduia sp.]
MTQREGQMLERIAEGLSVADIAAELHLSQATVKTHLRSLYAKLEVSERAAAVAAGMRRGLLT